MEAERTLLTAQRNDIFNAIKNADLNPLDFKWFLFDSQWEYWTKGQKIVYLNSPYYCKIDLGRPGKFSIVYSPGSHGEEIKKITQDWLGSLLAVDEWLQNFKAEIETVDLWEQAHTFARSFNHVIPDDLPNSPFSYQEVDRITEALRQLSSKIDETLKLQPEQLQYVESKVDFLIDEVKHQGRTTWIHTAIGMMVTIMMYLALPPDSAGVLWKIFKETIGPALGDLLGLPSK